MGPLKVALLATILAFAVPAHAQEAKKAEVDAKAEPAADAAAHYRVGVAAFEAGKFSEALAAFTEAYNLSSETDLLYNLGVCSEKIGDREKAIAYYQLYLEEKPDAPDAAEVKARLEAVRSAPAPAPAPAATPAPATADADEGAGTASEGGTRKNPHLGPGLLMGLGGVVVLTGAITAGSAYKKYKDLDSACSPDCADEKVDGVKAAALAADIQLAVGGAAVVAGFLWWLLKTRHEESATSEAGETARLVAAPFAAADGGGVRIEGRF